jgi:hypothetical protein
VIRVTPAKEPASFNEHVRIRGKNAIDRLLGKPVQARGRKPKKTYVRAEEIPPDSFPAYWTEDRKTDEESALDDMMNVYEQRCAYLAMHLEFATGSPTVDHFVPKSKNWRLVYEWSNYRLSAAYVNSKKGIEDVVDPFKVGDGWFELNLETAFVVRGSKAPTPEHDRIERTLEILNQRECVKQREQYIQMYRTRKIDLNQVELYAPFIAAEIRRQSLTI